MTRGVLAPMAVLFSTSVTGLDQASPFLDRKASPADNISSAKKQTLQRANESSMLWLLSES